MRPQDPHALFEQERERLIQRLGVITEGGIVENIQRIGAAAILAPAESSCLDIGLSAWPFPLLPARQEALSEAGYRPLAASYDAAVQRWQHETQQIQLHFVEAGSAAWTDSLLLRDYLREDPDAYTKFLQMRQEWRSRADAQTADYEAAKARFFTDMLPGAQAWWIGQQGFKPVEAIRTELEELPCPWFISSGWAIDLFLGRVTRVHHDLDIVAALQDQLVVQEYMTSRRWKWVTPYEDRLEAWPPRMRLELPRFQAHAHREGEFLDFLFSDIQNDLWRFRRNPSVIRTVEKMRLHTESGLPFLAPELVLLFKSKRDKETGAISRKKDEEDFAKVSPHLEPERRAWLLWALTVLDPTHPWIEALTLR